MDWFRGDAVPSVHEVEVHTLALFVSKHGENANSCKRPRPPTVSFKTSSRFPRRQSVYCSSTEATTPPPTGTSRRHSPSGVDKLKTSSLTFLYPDTTQPPHRIKQKQTSQPELAPIEKVPSFPPAANLHASAPIPYLLPQPQPQKTRYRHPAQQPLQNPPNCHHPFSSTKASLALPADTHSHRSPHLTALQILTTLTAQRQLRLPIS